jgi:hypothetical protein
MYLFTTDDGLDAIKYLAFSARHTASLCKIWITGVVILKMTIGEIRRKLGSL